VLLDGLGGDEWLFGTSNYYIDLVSRLRVPTLLWQIRYDARTIGMRAMLSRLLWHGINPLFPQSLRDLVKWILRKKKTAKPAWLTEEFARRIRLVDRKPTRTFSVSLRQLVRKNIWEKATTGFQLHIYELEDRAAAWCGFEQRHPFHDRRLVEFTLALPEEQRCRRGWTKYVLRIAMHDYLPETVRQRWDKAEFSMLTGRSLQDEAAAWLFDNLAIAALGWVDGQSVREMYREMSKLYLQNDKAYQEYTWELWTILGIELWYKNVFLYREALSAITQYDSSSRSEPAFVGV